MDSIHITKDELAAIKSKAYDEDLEFTGEDANVDWRFDYSGRGMYGGSCVGVVVPNIGTLLRLFAVMATVLDRDAMDTLYDAIHEDSMGYSTIYYFPGVTAEKAWDDDEDRF